MDKKMIQTISLFAEGIDEHNWEKVRQTLSDKVVLDSAPVGRAAREMTAGELIAFMQSASGAFQATCHHVGNFQCTASAVQFDLMALHYSTAGIFTLFRKMNAFMEKGAMTHIQTLVEETAGNTGLLQQSLPERLPSVRSRNTAAIERFFISPGDASLWSADAVWAIPFQAQPFSTQPFSGKQFSGKQFSGKQAILAHAATLSPTSGDRRLIDTDDPDVSLIAYGTVSVAALYFRDGLLTKVEDYFKG